MATKQKTGMDSTSGMITISAESREVIPVELVGEVYEVSTPKTVLAIRVAKAAQDAKDMSSLMDSLNDWVVAAFGPKSGAKVMARMEDPEDDLDMMHIVQLVQALMARTTGNPTT